jgi:4-amino-4-deoxy-L-arabinose transferase-like glycosyltransferase
MVKVKSKSELIPTLVYSIISIFYVYFQSSQIISLWDFTNYTDIAVRILNGQIPYLDIPLYTQPGTFVELAISMLIFGKNIYAVYLVILIKQFFIGFILSSLISKLFKNTLFDNLAVKIVWLVLFALLSPWSVVPQNTYDADLAFAILLAIYLLIKFDNFFC